MKVNCDLPEPWRWIEQRDDGSRHWRREGAEIVELEIMPLVLRGECDAHLLREALTGGADPSRVRVGRTSTERSAYAWPMQIAEVGVFEGDRLVEAQLVVLLEFIQHRATLRVRAAEPRFLTTHHVEIMAIICSARPDFTGDDVIALSQLWA